jgi:TolB-like protein/Flp pilus assembly protein TadD
MQPAAPEVSTCANCGSVLEETPGGGLGCLSCLLRAAIGSEEEVTQDSNPNAFEDGGRFGVYEIDRHKDGSLYELGRGAMGVTYRATDTSLQRKVALKIIKTDIAEGSADARERFMREARAAAALRHENIATIHQFGMRFETGQYFYAMELIEGETLDDLVRRAGPLDARITINIAQQVTSALAAAEKHGLVHRDLKPANLMLVSPDGETAVAHRVAPGTATQRRDYNVAHPPVAASLRRGAHQKHEKLLVKIIDFGLAKAIRTATDPKSLTHDRFVGTPAFASPEQFEHSALDVRSDIYSLGETLWFALTGKTPFSGRGMDEIRRAQQSNALPVEQLKAAHVPHRLKSLLQSMLAFEPASRPGTGELAAQLQRCSPEVRSVRRTRFGLAATSLMVLGMSAAIMFLWVRTQNSIPNLGAPEKSIAVLPFENRSEDKANAYFADGIQDEILTRLSKIADLKVISRTSTQQYQSKPANLREIAKQLGVANIVEGSVQKVANQVRVNVQLTNAQTDSHLWADTFDRKLTNIFGVESEIAKRIAESLQAKLTDREEQALAVKPTNNSEAYDAYLRGLAFETRHRFSFSWDLLWKAAGFYERAVQLDPNFAIAWARLSRADADLYFNRADAATAARGDAAKRALENAQNLEPNSPETLLALGYYQYWVLRDYGDAITNFARVAKMLPGNSEVRYALALVTRREGRWDQSVTYWEQALALDPRNMTLLSQAAWTYTILRQFPAALKLDDRALDITPNDPDVLASKASIYQAQGNLQEAARLLSEIPGQKPFEHIFATKITQLRLERNYGEAIRLLQARLAQFTFASEVEKAFFQLNLAFMQRLAGDTAGAKLTAEQARSIYEQLDRDQPERGGWAAGLSLACAAMGEKDSALKLADRAIVLLPRAKDAMDGPGFEENLALIQTMFGKNDRAISTLTQLLRTPYTYFFRGAPITPALLRLDPIWDPLRGDPSFQKLCEEKLDKRIAVLPFENLSDPHDEYFSDGLSEELISALAQISELKVIARSSSFRFKDRKEEPKTIGEKLGVSTLLEGTVRKQGDRVRIVAALTNAADGIELWTRTFDRELKDIFAVQEEIAKAVAESLKVKLVGSDDRSAQQAAPSSVEAHNAYLQGHFHFQRRNLDDYRKAVSYFDQAIELDPDYALAYAERSEAWFFIGDLTGEHTTAWPKAQSDAEKAVAIPPGLAEAHAALGFVRFFVQWKFIEGVNELKRAKELSPANPTAYDLLARVIAYLGRVDEAERQARQVVELDPLSVIAQSNLARVLLVAGKLDEADAAARKSAELQPAAAANHRWQVLVAVERGDGETALREAQLEPDEGYRRFLLALAQYVRGDRAAADAALADLVANGRDQLAYQIAELYAVRAEKDKAFEWLQISFDNHDSGTLNLLIDPLLRGLRDDPRYKAMLEKVGLPESL